MAGNTLTHSLKVAKAEYVKVSRNTADMFSNLKMLQIRFLIVILVELGNRLTFSVCNWRELGELEVEIPPRDVSPRNCHPEVIAALRPLLDMVIQYRYQIPGVECRGITALISTVEYRNGRYYVTIPNASLPWYLYVGKGVGFLLAETKIVFKLQSCQQMRLYFALLHTVDAKTKTGTSAWTLDKIREVIGVTQRQGMTYSRVLTRVIEPMITILNKYKAEISVDFKPSIVRGKKGRPSKNGGVFTVSPRKTCNKDDEYQSVLMTINRYYDKFSCPQKSKIRPRVDIVNEIIASGKAQGFLKKIVADENRVVHKYPDDDKRRPHIMAGRVSKILRDDFKIDVIESSPKSGFLFPQNKCKSDDE